MKQSITGMKHFANLLLQVLKQRPGDTVEYNTKLKHVIDFINFLQVEMPAIYEKWESGKK